MAEADFFLPYSATPYGALAVGEYYQPHLDDGIKHIPFDPEDRKTWGRGGQNDLLLFDCRRGSTHYTVTGGSGFYKSSTLLASMYTWTGSVVCLDPSGEIAPTVSAMRKAMGHDVRVLHHKTADTCAVNAIDWIDPTVPGAEGDVFNVVQWLTGRAHYADQTASFFKESGQTAIATFLANMLWSDDDPDGKNLANLRGEMSVPDDVIKKRLKLIADNSPSEMARDFASDLYDTPDETFGGIRRNAMEDTKWLSVPAYAKLVSGDTFRTTDILNGHTSVFGYLPINVLLDSPGLARTLMGAFLNTAFNAEGRIWGRDPCTGQRCRSRIWFPLDEAWTVGRMNIISSALYAGRKTGITMGLYYPAHALMRQQWGDEGAKAIEAVLSFRSFAAIKDSETAEKVSNDIGELGVLLATESANTGWQGLRGGGSSRSRGQSRSVQQVRRRLISKEEILYEMRDDEQIVFNVYGYPLRCARPIAWRRPEISPLLGQNPYLAIAEDEEDVEDDEDDEDDEDPLLEEVAS